MIVNHTKTKFTHITSVALIPKTWQKKAASISLKESIVNGKGKIEFSFSEDVHYLV